MVLNLKGNESALTPDVGNEVAAGMALAEANDIVFFRGIMRLDKVNNLGIGLCAVTAP